MDNGRFSIFTAVRNAYVFVGREWLYLLKAGLLPMGAQAASALFIQFQRPDASPIEGYLWELPATVLFAWFMFLETRLLLLGERLDRLPKDPAYLADRQQDMKLAILTWVLFDMGRIVVLAFLFITIASNPAGVGGGALFAMLFVIGGVFWGVRFGIVPTLAAVHYPIASALRQTWGMLFSIRLIALLLTCILPLSFLSYVVTDLTVPEALDPAAKLTQDQQITFTLINIPLTFISIALLNAALAYALKQILGTRQDGVTI